MASLVYLGLADELRFRGRPHCPVSRIDLSLLFAELIVRIEEESTNMVWCQQEFRDRLSGQPAKWMSRPCDRNTESSISASDPRSAPMK